MNSPDRNDDARQAGAPQKEAAGLALAEIGKSLAAALDLEAILPQVLRAAISLTGAKASYIYLIMDSPDNEISLKATGEPGLERLEPFPDPLDDLTTRTVLDSGRPSVLAEEGADGPGRRIDAPLQAGSELLGVLRVDQAPGQNEARLVELAGWAAIAIRNARLYEASLARSRDLEQLNEVTTLISGSLDPNRIPLLLVKRTAELLEAETGSLALIDHERDGIAFQLAFDSEGRELTSLKDFLMPLGQGIVGVVAQTGIPQVVNDPAHHPNWSSLADQMTGFHTRNLMAAPLIVDDQTLGVIEIVNKREGGFTEAELALLTKIASAGARAIHNGRRYAALRKINRTFEETQDQRIASERWTVLGRAAGSLAHRINNTTTLIPVAAQHLRELLQPIEMPPEVRRDVDGNLDRIERNTRYTVELAEILIHRFHNRPAVARDVNQLMERALDFVETPDNVKMVRHLDPDLPTVDTSDLLTDAFVELISNAIRAMAESGGILRVATFRANQDAVSIQITDSGPGITEEDPTCIFDMFYTTSPHGLGFGLWWVKTFLEQQHGEITVTSVPGEGTTFTITLPRTLPTLHSE